MALADWTGITSWTVSISEHADQSGNNVSTNTSHSGGGQLTLQNDGRWAGTISCTESSKVVDNFTIPFITTMSGSESWTISIELLGDEYLLSVSMLPVSGQVNAVTVATNTGESKQFVTTLGWCIFGQIKDKLPDQVGPIAGTVEGTIEEDGWTGEVDFHLAPSAASGSRQGGSAGSGGRATGGGGSTTVTPNAPPPKKKKHKFPVIPELLPKLVAGDATISDAIAYGGQCDKMGCQRCLMEWVVAWRDMSPNDIPDEAWDELDRLDKPANRLHGKYYCSDHAKQFRNARAGVALEWLTGATTVAGHTGWAVEMPQAVVDFYGKPLVEGPWMVGAFGTPFPFLVVPGRQDLDCPNTPQEAFRKEGYSHWKEMRSAEGNFEGAMIEACAVASSDYNLTGGNCLDATYAMLIAYGVDLWPPAVGVFPWLWFKTLPGDDTLLRTLKKAEKAAQQAVEDGPQIAAAEKAIPVLYQLKSGGKMHVHAECPALPGDARRIKKIAIEVFRSPEAVEQNFGVAVCERCVQHIRSEGQLRYRTMADDEGVAIFPDCVEISTPPGTWSGAKVREIPLSDIVKVHNQFNIWSEPIEIEYSLGIVGGNTVTTRVPLKFKTKEERDEFEQALDEARARA